MKAAKFFVSLSFGFAVCATASGNALANDFPTRTIRMVVPQSPGSGGDIVGRLMAESMTAKLGQPVVVENRAGANGVVAATSLAKEKPDGYTIMLGLVSQLAFNKHLYKKLEYDGLKDFTYINPVIETPYVLVVSKQSGITDFAGFLEKVRKNPGKLNYSSAGTGNMTHLSMALLASRQNLSMIHVPYKGSAPALTAVMAGETDAMVSVLGAALPQIASGAVVPVAILGSRRASKMPNVPTLDELGVAMPPIPGWYALVAPASMTGDVRDKLAAAVQTSLTDPALRKKLDELYLEAMPGDGEQIRARAVEESKLWGDFIRDNGISID